MPLPGSDKAIERNSVKSSPLSFPRFFLAVNSCILTQVFAAAARADWKRPSGAAFFQKGGKHVRKARESVGAAVQGPTDLDAAMDRPGHRQAQEQECRDRRPGESGGEAGRPGSRPEPWAAPGNVQDVLGAVPGAVRGRILS